MWMLKMVDIVNFGSVSKLAISDPWSWYIWYVLMKKTRSFSYSRLDSYKIKIFTLITFPSISTTNSQIIEIPIGLWSQPFLFASKLQNICCIGSEKCWFWIKMAQSCDFGIEWSEIFISLRMSTILILAQYGRKCRLWGNTVKAVDLGAKWWKISVLC